MATIALFFPTLFLVFTSVVFCGYLGAVNIGSFPEFSPENIIIVMSVSTIPAIIAQMCKIKMGNVIKLLEFPTFMLLVFFWGVYYSNMQRTGGIIDAVVDGKHFLAYILVFYCIIVRNKFNVSVVKVVLLGLSLALAFELILFTLMGLHPPGFLPVDASIEAYSRNTIHIMHPQIISVGLLICLFDKTIKPYPLLLFVVSPFLLIGLLLQGHMSITIITLATLLAVAAGAHKLDWGIDLFLLCSCIGVVLVIVGFLVYYNVIIAYREIGLLKSLTSRLVIGSQRIAYFLKQPLLGYGFVYKETNLGVEIARQGHGLHDLKLATVDSGYLDLLIRFGIVGTTLIIVAYARFCRAIYRTQQIYTRPVSIFLSFFIVALLTWSLLSYFHGIVFVGLATVLCISPFPVADMKSETMDTINS